MNDISAVIGLVQLENLDEANAHRRVIAEDYSRALRDVEWLRCPVEPEYTRSSWHNYVIQTPYRDALNLHLKDKMIATGVHYLPIHLQPYYRRQRHVSLPVAEQRVDAVVDVARLSRSHRRGHGAHHQVAARVQAAG